MTSTVSPSEPEKSRGAAGGLYNPLVQGERSPEFSLGSPLGSALAVLRGVLLSPRRFYLGFPADGPTREPAVFVLLVAAVTGVLGVAVTPIAGSVFGYADSGLGPTALRALAFVVLSPLGVGVAAAVYLLSVRTFVGKVGSFREVYRMAAYAFGAFVFAWIPFLGAFAVAYALMVLMGVGIRSVYRTSFMTAIITALVAFVPVTTGLIVLVVRSRVL